MIVYLLPLPQDGRQRSQPRSESYEASRGDKRRYPSPTSWDGRDDRKRSRKDWPNKDSTYGRTDEWVERSSERRGSDHHRSSSSSKDFSRERASEAEERLRRSPSRSSMGSRHSYRDDRHRNEPPREERREGERTQETSSGDSGKEASESKDREAQGSEEIKEPGNEGEEAKGEVGDKEKELEEASKPAEAAQAQEETVTPTEPAEKTDVTEPKDDSADIEPPAAIAKEENLESISSNGDPAGRTHLPVALLPVQMNGSLLVVDSVEPIEAGHETSGQSPEYDDISDDDLDDELMGGATSENEEGDKAKKGECSLWCLWCLFFPDGPAHGSVIFL